MLCLAVFGFPGAVGCCLPVVPRVYGLCSLCSSVRCSSFRHTECCLSFRFVIRSVACLVPYGMGLFGVSGVSFWGLRTVFSSFSSCLRIATDCVLFVIRSVACRFRFVFLFVCPAFCCYGAFSVSAGTLASTVLLPVRRVVVVSSYGVLLAGLRSVACRVVSCPLRFVIMPPGRGVGILEGALWVSFYALVVFPYPVPSRD